MLQVTFTFSTLHELACIEALLLLAIITREVLPDIMNIASYLSCLLTDGSCFRLHYPLKADCT